MLLPCVVCCRVFMQGYMATSARISFTFALKKARVPGRNVGKTNLFPTLVVENPTFSHDCASGEALTSCSVFAGAETGMVFSSVTSGVFEHMW